MSATWRGTQLHRYSSNKAELKALLGREPDGGVSPEQALALLEHLRWLDGLMPSERIRADQAARKAHRLEIFEGFKPRSRWDRARKS